ncbi:sugar ABC transporter ATP-binding protein [Arthrobacter crystallopoietes]|uniref:Monosaccharide ABC transporter ATP-binding protein, CUT2 family n=1 Tax=Crystallibacter crystallopoietes TaxID=37928 RepID=A0A1H1HXL5_9MICC|nr:sugar ABC transporter ATP-binding protein [Arthrobacter crystallopoietes]AUI53665.1 sugar ABC transporter ATP-binding protein [Arthrobacter crystallopoietes]SDR30201.1 monosaccharide ABC transporter ATP-binding protein, CUT2 family [Arthrobacter crystallopoietes]
MNALIDISNVSKTFPGVTALSGVSFDIRPGEIHALMGENGAGKSTLIKILAGAQKQSAGTIRLNGTEIDFARPQDAEDAGIRTVFQELNVVPQLSVAENICLGAIPGRTGFISRKQMLRQARESLAALGAYLPLDARAGTLPRSSQQLIEISRALMGDAKLLILDEPTASLGEQESRRLLQIVKDLAGRGVAILYITHRMHEVMAIADRVTVLRDGQFIETLQAPLEESVVVERMIGRPASSLYQHSMRSPGSELLSLHELTTATLRQVSLTLRAGEVVGIAGLLGSGKSEIGRACFGLDKVLGGQIVLDGRQVVTPVPAGMLAQGLVYYPSDRRTEGLVMGRPLLEAMTMGSHQAAGLRRFGFLRRAEESRRATSIGEALDLRPMLLNRKAGAFSGGNQQKAVLARGQLHAAKVHIFDEPTVGIDVGAKADVYRLIDNYAEAGHGVLVISSDLTEIIGISDRVYVMHEGSVSAHLTGAEITEEAIAHAFFAHAAA